MHYLGFKYNEFLTLKYLENSNQERIKKTIFKTLESIITNEYKSD